MTTLEIIYEVKEYLRVNSDDRSADIPEPLILFTYEKNRAIWLAQYFNRGTKHIDRELFQTIKIATEAVDASICPEISVGCKILRSKEELPSGIVSLHNNYMATAGPLDLTKKRYLFKPDAEYVNLAIGGRFANGIYTFPHGNHLFFVSKSSFVKSINNIALSAIFEEPSKVIENGICLGGDCTKYPMKMQYHTQVFEMTVKTLVSKFQIPLDSDNNSNPDMSQMAQQKQASK